MTFASDNWAGAADVVMAALAEANDGLAPAYGEDAWTERARRALRATFEADVGVLFLSTGSAANSLALAHATRPGGVVIGHVDGHILRDEAGAPAFFSPGLLIDAVDGAEGKMARADVAARVRDYGAGDPRHGRLAALSITNVNEFGQTYTPDEIGALARIAKDAGATVHVDGARFFNAVAHLGCTPADLTWRQGVDVLSLGLTKTGAWCAEAVVFFDPDEADEAAYRHKQVGQLLSKNRFAAAQFVALLERADAEVLARHANRAAAALADRIMASGEAELAIEPQSNEVFAFLAPAAAERLRIAGIAARPWPMRSAYRPLPPEPDWRLCRLVASFRTTEEEIDALAQALG